MSTVLVINVLGLALAAWASLFKIVPMCATSRFRYRLWRIRDEVVDEIRHDTYDDGVQPQRLVLLLETGIEEAHELSAVNMGLVRISVRGFVPKEPLDLERLRPEDANRLQQHLDTFEDAILEKVLFGTPSGWIFASILIPLALLTVAVGSVFRGQRGGRSLFEDAKRHVRDDLELDPALALMSKTRHASRDALYQHV